MNTDNKPATAADASLVQARAQLATAAAALATGAEPDANDRSQGGSYVYDPATKTRRLVDRTQAPTAADNQKRKAPLTDAQGKPVQPAP